MKFSKVDKFLSDLEAGQELYTQNYVDEKDKEIEKLQEDIGNYVNIVLHDRKEIDRLNNIINELERRFNQELENNEKWDIEDTKQFYSKKWYKDTLNDFKNMIKN